MATFITRLTKARMRLSQFRQISHNELDLLTYFLFERFTFSKSRAFPFVWKGMPFYARPIDMTGVREALLREEYGTVAPVLWAYKNSPLIIDGGANVGTFSMVMLNARPDANVYSIEPSRATFAVLARNIAVNGLPNWQGIQAALWKENGRLSFSNARASSASHIATAHELGMPSVEEVLAMTLNRFAQEYSAERIAILKLDIEGAEQAVLESADGFLAHVDNLVVELHPYLIDEQQTMRVIQRYFKYIYHIKRTSEKPLVFASNVVEHMPNHLGAQ